MSDRKVRELSQETTLQLKLFQVKSISKNKLRREKPQYRFFRDCLTTSTSKMDYKIRFSKNFYQN